MADGPKEQSMTTVRTRLRVERDGKISGQADKSVPAGEHDAILIVADHTRRRLATDFPVDDCGPWPEALRLSREELYTDDGR